MLTVSPGDSLLPVPSAIEQAIGYRPHPSTCTRWTRHGVRGVKLATVVVGGRPRTTEAAVIEFIEAQTANLEAAKDDPQTITTTIVELHPDKITTAAKLVERKLPTTCRTLSSTEKAASECSHSEGA